MLRQSIVSRNTHSFYTLCPKHPQCGCTDFCKEYKFTLSLATLVVLVAIALPLATLAPSPEECHRGSGRTCLMAGGSGIPGPRLPKPPKRAV
ncbi:MAG: hypothetical protein KME42_13790 [Tildeniella nuda ZEHNDER 1965/U140]|jgi:hypothetical protein|nr:hypothetical protein [Tildeniella nuda ZEHNDER 1965/U140]